MCLENGSWSESQGIWGQEKISPKFCPKYPWDRSQPWSLKDARHHYRPSLTWNNVKWVCAWDQLCSICWERSQESEPEKWGLEGFKLAKCALAGQRGPVCPQLISSKSSYVIWPRNKQMSTECPPPARHFWRCSSSVSLSSWKISCC